MRDDNDTKAAVIKMLMGDPNSPAWSILTSDTNGVTDDELVEDFNMLLNMLNRRGWYYLLVDGYYDGRTEQAVFVIGMASGDACRFSLFFDQQAYLTSGGLFYRGNNGWYQRTDFQHRHVVDGTLTSTRYDRSVIHCSDGELVFMCEVG